MQEAEVVLGVLRERGRKGLPLTQLYRQMFNKDLYLAAYGNIYSNQGAMTPGPSQETADGMSEDLIDEVIGQMRRERYRFAPARASGSRRRPGSCARWGCRRGRTSWSARWCACFWKRITSRGFPAGRTGSARSEGVIPRCGRYKAPGPGPRGSLRVTSPTAPGLWIMML